MWYVDRIITYIIHNRNCNIVFVVSSSTFLRDMKKNNIQIDFERMARMRKSEQNGSHKQKKT